jgi:hypothetical protein
MSDDQPSKTRVARILISSFFLLVGLWLCIGTITLTAPWLTFLMDGTATGTVQKVEANHDEDVKGYIISYNLYYEFFDQNEHRHSGKSLLPRDTFPPLESGQPVEIHYFRWLPWLNGTRPEASLTWRLPVSAVMLGFGLWFLWTGRYLRRTGKWPSHLGGQKVRWPETVDE